MGVGGQSHAAAALCPGKSADRPTYFKEGWVDPRAGMDGYEESSLPPIGVQTPNPPARSESL